MKTLINHQVACLVVELFVLRHGKAEKRSSSLNSDAGRALTGEGRTEILGVAEFLASRDVVFGCVATSPYVRALETAQIVTKALGQRGLLMQWDELMPGSSIESLESRISSRPEDESLLLIGHEPLLGKFTGYMSSRETAPVIGRASTGTMRASSWNRIPLIRMTTISLEPGAWALDDLIADTEHGIYMETNNSWSIDDKRLNFQFACEIGWEIENGTLGRVVKSPNYTGITPPFWNPCFRRRHSIRRPGNPPAPA